MKTKCHLLGFAVLAGWLAWGANAQEPAPVERGWDLIIALKPRASVATALVRIGDVAELRGGNAAQRARAAALDLAELEAWRRELTISQEQVYFRLHLGGLGKSQIRFTGAAATVVSRGDGKKTSGDSKDTAAAAPAEIIQVKNRDAVRLLARIGTVRVSTRGEALQDGQVGQVIRVRNIHSNRIVNGRLLENNIVEVDY